MKLVYYKHNKYEGMPEMLPMKIAFNELTLLLDGNVEYSFNGEIVRMKSGDVVYARANSTRARKKIVSCDYVSFNFTAEREGEAVELPLFLENAVTAEIKLLLSACDEIVSRAQGEYEEQILLILRCILLQLQQNRNAPGYGTLTRRITGYVREHLSEKITLEDVSRAAFFSPVYCSVVFKRETGKTITDYILSEKIEEAKILVAQGVRLKEVAELVGISDYNYFSRVFRKRVGYTPSQYRKFTQAK